MTKRQLEKAINLMVDERVLTEFTTRYQSTEHYRQYHIMGNLFARLVIFSDSIVIETKYANVEVLKRHLTTIYYSYVNQYQGVIIVRQTFKGKVRNSFTSQLITIEHEEGK